MPAVGNGLNVVAQEKKIDNVCLKGKLLIRLGYSIISVFNWYTVESKMKEYCFALTVKDMASSVWILNP